MVKDDYAALVSDVQALVDKVGDINILPDLTDFHWEKISAWGADLKFGDRAVIAALEGSVTRVTLRPCGRLSKTPPPKHVR